MQEATCGEYIREKPKKGQFTTSNSLNARRISAMTSLETDSCYNILQGRNRGNKIIKQYEVLMNLLYEAQSIVRS
jgi:hypothetical protein